MIAWLEHGQEAVSENVTVTFDVVSTSEQELMSVEMAGLGKAIEEALPPKRAKADTQERTQSKHRATPINIHLLLFACDRPKPLRRLWASLLNADYSAQPLGVDIRILVDFSAKEGHDE